MANGSPGNQTKAALYLIQPGGIGWGVMHVEARELRQPGAYFGIFVRGVAVDYEIEIGLGGNTSLQATQEAKELLMAVTGLALGKHRTGSDIERRK